MPFAERDDLILRLSTSMKAGGQPPDLFLMNYRFHGQFAARGHAGAGRSVPPGLRRVLRSRLLRHGARASAGTASRCACRRTSQEPRRVLQHRSLPARGHVALPKDGWSWDDMVAAAKQLTRDRDGDGTVDTYGLGVDPEIIRVAPFIWSNGGADGRRRTSPTRFALDGAAVVALDQFFDLRTVHGVTPTDEEAEAEDFVSRFLNDRLAMLMESRRVVPTLRTMRRLRLGCRRRADT